MPRGGAAPPRSGTAAAGGTARQRRRGPAREPARGRSPGTEHPPGAVPGPGEHTAGPGLGMAAVVVLEGLDVLLRVQPPLVLPSSASAKINMSHSLDLASGAAQALSLPPSYPWPDLTSNGTLSLLPVLLTRHCPNLSMGSCKAHRAILCRAWWGTVFCTHSSRHRDALLPVTVLIAFFFPEPVMF